MNGLAAGWTRFVGMAVVVLLTGCGGATAPPVETVAPTSIPTVVTTDAAATGSPVSPAACVSDPNTGWDLVDRRKWAEALEVFECAMAGGQLTGDVFAGRCYALIQLGQADMALADCARAVELDPSSADARVFRGMAYAGQGMTDLALADYDEAIRLDHEHSNAYANRGNAYDEMGQLTGIDITR